MMYLKERERNEIHGTDVSNHHPLWGGKTHPLTSASRVDREMQEGRTEKD
jgi:ribosomal protein L31